LNVKFVDFSQLKNPSAADKSEEYPMQFTLADVHLSSPHPDLPADQLALFFSPNGTMGWIPFSDTVVRVMGPVPMAETPPKEPSVDYVNELVKRRGIDGPIIDRIIWGGLFRTRSCIALEFVVPFGTNTASGHGAVILAGDASHVHSPAGGQGMNLGIRDGILLGDAIAVDMAWEGPSISDRLVRFGKERQQAASDITKVMEWIAWVIMTPGTGWRRVMRDTLLRLIGPFGFIQRSIALKLSGMSNI
jgi:2-polyprenyl-6-methoxyphenol hydroxylase-like FAD-dependent oxidoreductase